MQAHHRSLVVVLKQLLFEGVWFCVKDETIYLFATV